jgi:Domain of unknown function (DUF4158)
MASVDRTAYPRLPATVSGRELAETFTPTAEEARWACTTIAEPGTRLLLLVLLKCYQRLGYFPQLDQVPAAATEHVHAQAATLVADRIDAQWRPSERMIRRCRELVRQRVGAVWDPDRVRVVARDRDAGSVAGQGQPSRRDQRGIGGVGRPGV